MSTTNKKGRRPSSPKRSIPTHRIGDQIVQGLREAIAFERGELAGAKITRRELPDTLAVRGRSRFDGKRIASLRERLCLSQPLFARALNVSAETVKKWEQDKREPDGAAVRLLEVAEDHPEWLIARLGARNGRGPEKTR